MQILLEVFLKVGSVPPDLFKSVCRTWLSDKKSEDLDLMISLDYTIQGNSVYGLRLLSLLRPEPMPRCYNSRSCVTLGYFIQ